MIDTPGHASGTARTGPVVVEGALWALGVVPLDTAVLPSWTLHNAGSEAVSLGPPHAAVRSGCCPGPLTLDRDEILPGERATLTFELAMHQGMDGWHDIAVHVPVTAGGETTSLELAVTGDFGNP